MKNAKKYRRKRKSSNGRNSEMLVSQGIWTRKVLVRKLSQDGSINFEKPTEMAAETKSIVVELESGRLRICNCF